MIVHLTAIKQIAIHADDLKRSRQFYEELLGAAFMAEFDPPGLLFFNFQGVRLLLEEQAPLSLVYFWVEDIDESYRQLLGRGVKFEDEPHCIYPDVQGTFGPAGEEEWMVFFKDPAGNTLALVSRKPTTKTK